MVHVVLVPAVHCCNKVVLNRPCCVFASWLFSAKLVYKILQWVWRGPTLSIQFCNHLQLEKNLSLVIASQAEKNCCNRPAVLIPTCCEHTSLEELLTSGLTVLGVVCFLHSSDNSFFRSATGLCQ